MIRRVKKSGRVNKETVYPLKSLAQTLNGQLLHADPSESAGSVCIDSRTLQKGDWFVCIRGERTDGHLYLQQALEQGASGAVVQTERIPESLLHTPFPQIRVADPNLALREWASLAREQFPGKVLGITGSNGKTSTKELLSRLCLIIDKNTHATRGNLNNLFGVPLTLLRANPKARWWVIEMGTNQFGEIGELSRISRPDGAILTSIAESHLEFLKNTEGVAAEKRDIMAGMPPGSSLVVPADLKHLDLVQEKAKQQEIRIVRYALEDQNQKAEWTVSRNITSEGFKGFELFGENFTSGALHPLQLRNLTAALVLLYENGVDAEQLQQAVSGLDFQVSGRFEWKRLDEGWLIDDSYNANPGSFRGVLQSIRFMHPKTPLIAVIGPMAELGENAEQFHSEVGEVIYHSGCKKLLVLGGDLGESYLEGWKNAGGPKENAKRFESLEELQNDFQQDWDQKSIVLVKGSRSAAMERFVKAILNHESE